MLDTPATARSLTNVDFTPAQADAVANAVRLAAEHGDHVTRDRSRPASPSCARRSLACGAICGPSSQPSKPGRWVAGAALAALAAGIGAVAALPRFWLPG